MKIDIMSAYYLILRYPLLAKYIEESYNRGNHEEIIDLLWGLEVDETLRLN